MSRVEAAIVALAALGTIPAVGGYSNTVAPKVERAHTARERIKAHSEFATVGIVTRTQGKAFVMRSKTTSLQTGSGIWLKDLIWVEPGSTLEIVDVHSNRFVFSGPAVARLSVRHLHVYRGSYLIETAENEKIALSHGDDFLFSAEVRGKLVVWAKIEQAQILSLGGASEVWNPAIDGEKIMVTSGKFVSSSTRFKHLQVTLPQPVDFAASKEFLARFGVSSLEESREPASEDKTFVGSRDKKEIVEPLNEEHIERLQAKLVGKDVEDDEGYEQDFAASGGKRVTLKSLRSPAGQSQGGPSVEVKPSSGLKLSNDEKAWIEKLRKGR